MKGVMEQKRDRLMGLEGMCSREYFGALALTMPEKWRFGGRSRNPAEDGFNCRRAASTKTRIETLDPPHGHWAAWQSQGGIH